MNNYEKIKRMNIDEMARFMYDLQCEECYYIGGELVDYKDCREKDCWCHKESGDKTYKKWLESEVEE